MNVWMRAVGNKGTGTQEDFVKPEGQIENLLLVWCMKKLVGQTAQFSCYTISTSWLIELTLGKGMVCTPLPEGLLHQPEAAFA